MIGLSFSLIRQQKIDMENQRQQPQYVQRVVTSAIYNMYECQKCHIWSIDLECDCLNISVKKEEKEEKTVANTI